MDLLLIDAMARWQNPARSRNSSAAADIFPPTWGCVGAGSAGRGVGAEADGHVDVGDHNVTDRKTATMKKISPIILFSCMQIEEISCPRVCIRRNIFSDFFLNFLDYFCSWGFLVPWFPNGGRYRRAFTGK